MAREEEEASGAFACQRGTSALVEVAAAVAEKDIVSFARSVCQGVPIPEEGLHAVAAVDLHYYTSIRVVEVHEEVRAHHHVASVAAAAGCTEEARHTEDVLREEVQEKGTPGYDGADDTAELRTRSMTGLVSAIPCVRLRLSWSSICYFYRNNRAVTSLSCGDCK